MNPIVFALRHPITIIVMLAAILVGSGLALSRMKVDIFPNLDLPVIYVVQPYGGMDPEQMEGLLTFHFENHFLYISGIHHIESKNIQSFAQMKLFFHPGTDMVQAMAETVAQVNRARSFMPAGTVPPFVVRFDAGTLPVGYIVLSSKTSSIDVIQEQAYLRVRPALVSLPGVSAPPPFGGNQRTIIVHVDPDRMRSKRLSPNDVVEALSSGNAITPSGNVRVKDMMPIVPVNAMVLDPQELAQDSDPAGGQGVSERRPRRSQGRKGRGGRHGYSGQFRPGQRTPSRLHDGQQTCRRLNPGGRERDQVPPGTDAGVPAGRHQTQLRVRPVAACDPGHDRRRHGRRHRRLPHRAYGAGVPARLALGRRRRAEHPVRDPGSDRRPVDHRADTEPDDAGRSGVSIGILVDESTVEVENIHSQMERTGSVALAVWRGNCETAVPRLLAMLCILAVFIPSAFMEGAARNLFVPLSLAVGFAMVSSYFLSSTFVPVLSTWLLRHHHHVPSLADAKPGRFSFGRLRNLYVRFLRRVFRRRWIVLPAYLCLAALVIGFVGMRRGTEIFPAVDSGQFQLRIRAASGTRIERTEEIARQTLDVIKAEAGAENVDITVGFGGVSPTSYTINTVYLWTAGSEEVLLRVGLKHGSGIHVEEFKERLRQKIPEHLASWMRTRLIERPSDRGADQGARARLADVVRAVRHRQRSHEFRLAHADRSRS